MAQANKTFRIFVSSTFTDLKEERNALQRYVFPRLRDLCMQHGCRFQAIDLRWGVSEEAGRDQQTMKICLEEIARCQKTKVRPNFIVLLGDRYGWCPLPSEIPKIEFDQIMEKITDDDKKLIIQWYMYDENALPHVYCLKEREVNIAEDAADDQKKAAQKNESEEWRKTETELRLILIRAIDQLGWQKDDIRRVKYEASATEQEINQGALKPDDAQKHVFCFFRKINGWPQVINADNFFDIDNNGKLDNISQSKLDNLKMRLSEQLPGNVSEYNANWTDKDLSKDHIGTLPEKLEDCLKLSDSDTILSGLCGDIWRKLSKVIKEEIAQFEDVDALKNEIENHNKFGKERTRFFVGRDSTLKKISDYVKGADTHPLAVFGVSGSGKSALMARAVELVGREHKNAEVIVRFIGATPESSDGRALLEILSRQTSRSYEADESTIPNDYNELVEDFPKRLSLATSEKPLFIFLDALDQLSTTNNANSLIWIPRELPPHVHLVVSTLHGEEKKLSSSIQIELEKMLLKDGNVLLDLWLKDAKRSLQKDQKNEVLNKFEKSGLPLYLKLAFEEARRWKSYDAIPLGSNGKQGLSEDVPGIIRDMFSRLSTESNHGNMLVSRSMGYFAASKNGLTEDEMLDVLSEDYELYQDFLRRARHTPSEKKLPVVIWSRLYFDLEPYLTERSADGTSLMAFFHRQVGEVAREYHSGHMKQYFHRALSNYFTGQPLQSATDGLKSPNVRKVSELPYQQTLGQMWDELIGTLTEFTFTIAKCAADKVDELENDYERAVTAIPVPSKGFEIWKAFFQERIHILRRSKKYWPAYKIFLQLAVEHADDSPITLAAEAWLQKGNCDWVWLKRKQRLSHVQLSRCLITIEEQTAVEGALIWPDGRLISWSGDNELKVWDTKTGTLKATLKGHADLVVGALKLSNGMLASWSNDNTLRIWSVETGELKTTLRGHTGSIRRALELLDGHLLSWSEDKTLRVWDVTTGQLKTTFEDHTRPVYGALELPDGFIVSWDGDNKLRVWNIRAGNLQVSLIDEGKVNRALTLSSGLLVVWGDNNTLYVWDIEKGKLNTTLEGHTKQIYAALELSNKRLVSWSYDNTLRVWDIETGKTEITLEGHTKSVWGAVELSNDRLVSWGGDDTLRIWNLKDGNSLAILEGHKLMIQGALELPDRRLVSWAYDNTLRVWNQKGDLQFVLEGHCDFIYGALLLLDKCLVSWGNDNTIRIWNIEGEEHKATLRCHADRVKGMLLLSDGRVVSWADDLIGDPDLLVWDIASGDLMSTLKGHLDGITGAMKWSDKRLISWSYDKTLKVWDLETGEIHTTLTGHEARIIGALAWSDRLVVSWAHDVTLRVWEVENGELKLTLEGHTLPVEGALKLSDGRLLSWSLDNSLKVWNVDTGKIVTTLDAHTKGIIGAMELSDGQLVSWAKDNMLIIWDVNTGKSKVKLEGHKKKVWKVLELSNGSLVSWTGDPLSGKNDHELYIWDVNTGDLKVTLEGHTGWVEGVIELSNGCIMSWTSEGNVINDHTLRVWDVKTGKCLLTISKEEAPFLYPDLLAARAAADPETRSVRKADFVGWAVGSISGISPVYAGAENIPLWHAESLSVPRLLLDNGTFIVSEKNGQVSFLELHHGNHSINLDELKGMSKNG